MAYSTAELIRVYNDDTGEYIQISEDADALELVETTLYENEGKVHGGGNASIFMTVEEATQVHKALGTYLERLKKK